MAEKNVHDGALFAAKDPARLDSADAWRRAPDVRKKTDCRGNPLDHEVSQARAEMIDEHDEGD